MKVFRNVCRDWLLVRGDRTLQGLPGGHHGGEAHQGGCLVPFLSGADIITAVITKFSPVDSRVGTNDRYRLYPLGGTRRHKFREVHQGGRLMSINTGLPLLVAGKSLRRPKVLALLPEVYLVTYHLHCLSDISQRDTSHLQESVQTAIGLNTTDTINLAESVEVVIQRRSEQ